MKADPLIVLSLKMGRELAMVHGGDYRKHAYEYYTYSKVAEQVMKEALIGNEANWNTMTFEEKSEVSQEALRVLADRNKVAEVASKLRLH